MVDPTGGVTAAHLLGSGDYTLKYGSTGTHNYICERVLDQYKEERKICESNRFKSGVKSKPKDSKMVISGHN